jgi:hypothetical protein
LTLTRRDDLWNGSKSVMVSEDRTAMLTILWRVCCKQIFAIAHLRIRAQTVDGDDEIDGQKRSKKTRRVKPFWLRASQPP